MISKTYTKSPCALDSLISQIQHNANITVALDLSLTNIFGDQVTITFLADLSDFSFVDAVVAAHNGVPLVQNQVQATTTTDQTGAPLNQYDVDKALVVRQKAAKSGWTYAATAFEFLTSKLASIVALNYDGTSKSWITIHLFDVGGVEITDPSLVGNAVRTQVDFEPPYDYELIGGEMRITPQLTSDVRFFIIAVPTIPASYGGSKVMAEGLNLKYLNPGNMFSVDGRVSKLLSYSATNHTNKLRFLFWHNAGVQENLMITVEHYRQ